MKVASKRTFSPMLMKVIRASADPARAEDGLTRLAAAAPGVALAKLSEAHARILTSLFAGSEAMGQLLLRQPDFAQELLSPDNLTYPRQEQGLRRDVQAWLPTALAERDYAGALTKLRRFRQREMLRIAARDLARLDDVMRITREISIVADVCLDATLMICRQQLEERFGQPYHQDAEGAWRPTQFAVLGLGKLGGQELNYSSDVDVMFVYSEE